MNTTTKYSEKVYVEITESFEHIQNRGTGPQDSIEIYVSDTQVTPDSTLLGAKIEYEKVYDFVDDGRYFYFKGNREDIPVVIW